MCTELRSVIARFSSGYAGGHVMTYDPYRNDDASYQDGSWQDDSYRDYRNEDRTAAGAAILLGAVLLAAIGGLIYFYSGASDRNIATNDLRPPITQPSTTGAAPAPETTGSSANMPPVAEPKAEQRVKPVE
jgi:hypothetical protein